MIEGSCEEAWELLESGPASGAAARNGSQPLHNSAFQP